MEARRNTIRLFRSSLIALLPLPEHSSSILTCALECENKQRTLMEVQMNRTDEVVARALALVAASRALREKQERQRKETYERVQIASLRKPNIPKGIQLPLNPQ